MTPSAERDADAAATPPPPPASDTSPAPDAADLWQALARAVIERYPVVLARLD
jgi:hypothetical protein